MINSEPPTYDWTGVIDDEDYGDAVIDPRPGVDLATTADVDFLQQLAVVAAGIASQSGQAYGEVSAALMEATVLVDRLRADLADAQQRIAAADALHVIVEGTIDIAPHCFNCALPYPCPTVQALSAGGGGPAEGGERHAYTPTATSEFGVCVCGAQWNDPIHAAVSGRAADTGRRDE